jgi:riboflavin-specific deaminase-like protein
MTRPHVTLNMASSIDGKITTASREALALGSIEDRRQMERLRAETDAIMVGSGTFRDEDPTLIVRDPQTVTRRVASGRRPQPLKVLVTSDLDVDADNSRFFEGNAAQRLILTTDAAPAERVAALEANSTVAIVTNGTEGRVNLRAAMEVLAGEGVSRLLLEGGGTLNFAMLEAGLIDEVYLTLCPFIIGGSRAPTTFEGVGFDREGIRGLELISMRTSEHGEIFFRYRVADAVPDALARPKVKAAA